MNITDLVPTFNALKPALAADFTTMVTRTLEGLIKDHGSNIGQLAHSWHADGYTYRNLGYRFLSGRYSGSIPTINMEAVEKAAQQYADDQIAAFTMKLVKKLVNLTNVEIKELSVNSFTFYITGNLGERRVSVEQNRIINVSKLGNLFHQWPARIRVDGKAHSEAQFKKLAP